ncbi:DUF2730 family protein [Paracoccus denitrificans]|uniref:DUF2730 family protein n=1 Tax=Paracoccus denitrificans TaxID=266 RepID=UPI0033650FD1
MEGQILNISPIVVWVIALSQLLTFGLTVWNLIASGSRANARTLETHGETLRGLDSRLSAVELSMREIPTRKDFHDLDKQMTELRGSIGVLMERLRPVEAISERLQEVMIEQRK